MGQGEVDIRSPVRVVKETYSIRVMGRDRPGIAAQLTRRLAEAGINLRGFAASVIGTQFVAYVGVDSFAAANKAMEVLQKA